MPIAVCNCKNAYQDTRYGTAYRVVNPINKSKNQGVVQRYRCTVCKSDVDKSQLRK